MGAEENNEMKEKEGVGQTACTTTVRNSYKILVGSPKQESTRETQQ